MKIVRPIGEYIVPALVVKDSRVEVNLGHPDGVAWRAGKVKALWIPMLLGDGRRAAVAPGHVRTVLGRHVLPVPTRRKLDVDLELPASLLWEEVPATLATVFPLARRGLGGAMAGGPGDRIGSMSAHLEAVGEGLGLPSPPHVVRTGEPHVRDLEPPAALGVRDDLVDRRMPIERLVLHDVSCVALRPPQDLVGRVGPQGLGPRVDGAVERVDVV
mmetsp:Transcript_6183/g.15249  ORF Transcript_6183/g.15249 Transcript_6183/m.15249 type:complete len:215 (-) Transcript_6183:243-887(-)